MIKVHFDHTTKEATENLYKAEWRKRWKGRVENGKAIKVKVIHRTNGMMTFLSLGYSGNFFKYHLWFSNALGTKFAIEKHNAGINVGELVYMRAPVHASNSLDELFHSSFYVNHFILTQDTVDS